jgi:hypothetical protein
MMWSLNAHVCANTHLLGFLRVSLLQQVPAVSISCCILISVQACECATLIRLLGLLGLQSNSVKTAVISRHVQGSSQQVAAHWLLYSMSVKCSASDCEACNHS